LTCILAGGMALVGGVLALAIHPCFAALVRNGDKLTGSTKFDKGDWVQLVAVTPTLPEVVIVGVLVGGRTGPFTTEFTDFNVKRLGVKLASSTHLSMQPPSSPQRMPPM